MEKIKAKIQGILLNYSQKSVIGWAVEESDFEDVANEIVKKLTLTDVVERSEQLVCDCKKEIVPVYLDADGKLRCETCKEIV